MGSDFFNTFGVVFFENAPESGRADRFSCVEIGSGRRGLGFGVSSQQTATAANPRTTPSLLSANAGLMVCFVERLTRVYTQGLQDAQPL